MSTSPALIRETFPVGPLQCNCTIIGDPLTRKAIVVDPGGDHELILQRLDRLGLQVVSIIHTHAHRQADVYRPHVPFVPVPSPVPRPDRAHQERQFFRF